MTEAYLLILYFLAMEGQKTLRCSHQNNHLKNVNACACALLFFRVALQPHLQIQRKDGMPLGKAKRS